MRPFTDDRREALRERVREVRTQLPLRGRGLSVAPDRTALRELAAGMGELGLLGYLVPRVYGGATESVEPLALAVIREELAYTGGLADATFAVQGLAAHVLTHADVDLRRRWLPALASGHALGAFAVTEPEAGSDLAAVATRARRDGDDYVLDGSKVFISNAGLADVYVLFARSEAGDWLAFAVPGDSAGLDASTLDLLGPHPVGALKLRGVRLPVGARIGAAGDGLRLCLSALETFRPTVGASACGLARRALDEALRRTSGRRQFGAPLADQPTVQFTLADMATELEAARALVYRAAWLKETAPNQRHGGPASMAKLFATETAQTIVDRALQLHGASGLVRDSVIASLYTEVRALRIYEGTSEIQRLVIAKALRSL